MTDSGPTGGLVTDAEGVEVAAAAVCSRVARLKTQQLYLRVHLCVVVLDRPLENPCKPKFRPADAKRAMTTQGSSTAKRVPSGPRANRKRQAIIQAARETFLAEGFDASMDRVATVAGVSKVTVYNHFDSKESLFIAVITGELDGALEEAERLVESTLVTSADVRADLIQACRAWVAGVCAPETITLRNLVAGEMRRFPELGETWQERGPQRFHRVVAAALGKLNEMRELSIPDVDLAVLQLSGLVVSPSQVYGAYGSPPDPELADRLIVSGVDMFLHYYGYGGMHLKEVDEGRPRIGNSSSCTPIDTAVLDA